MEEEKWAEERLTGATGCRRARRGRGADGPSAVQRRRQSWSRGLARSVCSGLVRSAARLTRVVLRVAAAGCATTGGAALALQIYHICIHMQSGGFGRVFALYPGGWGSRSEAETIDWLMLLIFLDFRCRYTRDG